MAPAPDPAEETPPSEPGMAQVLTMMDLALAANALVKAALEMEGKHALTQAAAAVTQVLGTAREAGWIDPA